MVFWRIFVREARGSRGAAWLAVMLLAWMGPIEGRGASPMVVETYPLGMADFEESVKAAGGIVSSEGKLVADRQGNRLIVLDFPERHAKLRAALAKVEAPTHHVRIQVNISDVGDVRVDALGKPLAVGGDKPPDRPGPNGNPSFPNAEEIHAVRVSNAIQELIVISGGRARIRIGNDVPNADWIWEFGLRQGFWIGKVGWQQVGAQMIIEPYVMGNRIRLRFTPEFSYVLDRERLTTALDKLTSEVMVDHGEEVDLGGLPDARREFYSRFLVGYDLQHEKQPLRIRLKATIE